MIVLPGYDISEIINRGTRVDVYRGLRQADRQPIVAKVLKAQYPQLQDIAKLRHEYQLTRSLAIEGVVKSYTLEKYHNGLALILEAFGHESLRQVLQRQQFSLSEFLQIAIQLSETLGQLHQQGIIHKDIKPANIIFDVQSGFVKITDFGISSLLAQETQTLSSPHEFQGTLAYMSPEQTGRMNRAIDYRTDFYSLGVSFYEILTGQLPFAAQDPMELVHAHLAKTPVPPHQLRPEIPPILSEIVLKLLSKIAENRYQSAFGLKADLDRCLAQWQSTGDITTFVLSQQDYSGKLQISQKLYGRETELQTLLTAFDRLSQAQTVGQAELVLVSGYSGIGKSALVNEIHKPVTQQRGYFVAGKCDQLQRNVPYAPFRQAFQGLVAQLLAEDIYQLSHWQERLLTTLGSQAQVIIEVIPDVELIIGPQPPVAELSPIEAQTRFNRVFSDFVQVFTQSGQPLVLFVDDLQWADAASLHLLQLLATESQPGRLLLMGAYRSHEVEAGHPLREAIALIQQRGGIVHQLEVGSLPLAQVEALLGDTLANNVADDLQPLAAQLFHQTQGNPFFLRQLLTSLNRDQLLTFDFAQGCWQWNLSQIKALGRIDLSVADLLTATIERLPAPTQEILQLAACLGNRFELTTLALVCDQSPLTLAQRLWPSLQQGLVLPLSGDYQRSLALQEEDLKQFALEDAVWEYRFLHDRVQQTVYSLLSDQQRQAIHLKIGRLLLQHIAPTKRQDKIFDIVNQLNVGAAAIESVSERLELARLNLAASQKAKRAAAFEPACRYAQGGINLLEETIWQSHYNLALVLHLEAAETAYFVGALADSERWVQRVLAHAATLLDRVKAYEIQIRILAAQKQLGEAVNLGLATLKLLQINLPPAPTEAQTGQALMATANLITHQTIQRLGQLPRMSEPRALAATQILGAISAAAYVTNPQLFALIHTQIIQLSVKYGNAPQSVLAYSNYGLLLCGLLNQIEVGYQLGRVVLDLLAQFPSKELAAKITFMVANFINPWKFHLRDSLPNLQASIRIGLEAGDLEYATWGYWRTAHFSYLTGEPLGELAGRLDSYCAAVERLKQEAQLNVIQLQAQVVANWRGQSADPMQLVGAYYDAATSLTQYEATGNFLGLYELHLHQLMLHYSFKQPRLALPHAEVAAGYVAAVPAAVEVTLLYFYDSLTRLALLAEETTAIAQKDDWLAQVEANQAKLQNWATHAPMNYQHKYDLVAAEQAKLNGEIQKAMSLYDLAIQGAKEMAYVQEEALACELAGEFYLSLGRDRIARAYLLDAFYGYLRWDAKAKLADLEQRYPMWLSQLTAEPRSFSATGFTTTTTSSTSKSLALDMVSVIKASQTIAEEIVLDSLLARLMRILIENAGAEIGYLILHQGDDWTIQAEGRVNASQIQVLQSIALADEQARSRLAIAIINYVIRTQENVVLSDAATDNRFAGDPYIQQHRPKSILCAPLAYRGRLSGVIYLENNLTTDAFNFDRLETLNLLAAQAAISIENALLYRQQKKLNQDLAALNQDLTSLNQAYERFIPRQFLQLLDKRSIVDVRLGDQVQREMSVLFADIRAFTALSEKMTPAENFRFINTFLSRMEPAIAEHGGFVDKYIGDAIMALFDGTADNALRAGITMLRILTDFNQQQQLNGLPPIRLGIGINTGLLMLGTVGGNSRMDSTVISDAVNVASRIEQLTKEYMASLLISHDTFIQLSDPNNYALRLIGHTLVRGRASAISVYEVFDADPPEVLTAKNATRSLFEQSLVAYAERNWRVAAQGFEACLRQNAADQIARLYLGRCQQQLAS
ncbi:AAA family ATPase [Almyronema epifaneia]|uniref:AAA family ATPase n=1 Tax=Almyronema epifaneia S1 TaxID=2991925 RepID=A0ABW6IGF6_9CYAN